MFEEDNCDALSGIQIIGASGDPGDLSYSTAVKQIVKGGNEHRTKGKRTNAPLRENFLTIAVATTNLIRIYTVDSLDSHYGINSMNLVNSINAEVYITSLSFIRVPSDASLNFSAGKASSEWSATYEQLLVASTDDGHIICWDATSIRNVSEDSFRKRHNSYQPIASTSPSQVNKEKRKTKRASANVTSTPHGKANKTENGAVEDSNDSETIREIRESSDLSMERGDDDYDDDDEGDEEEEEEEEGAFLTDLSLNSPGQKSKLDTSFPKTMTYKKASQGCICTALFRLDEKGIDRSFFVPKISSFKVWRGHADTIIDMIPLDEHGCLVSSSMDGYQRIWNVDGDCLGEMVLPNITDAMKYPEVRVVPATKWKFILERIDVTAEHRAIAAKLVSQISNTSKRVVKKEKMVKQQSSKSCPALPGLSHSFSPQSPTSKDISEQQAFETDKRNNDRNMIFQDLRDAPKRKEDTPPDSVQSKQEIKLLKELEKALVAERALLAVSTRKAVIDANSPVLGSLLEQDSLSVLTNGLEVNSGSLLSPNSSILASTTLSPLSPLSPNKFSSPLTSPDKSPQRKSEKSGIVRTLSSSSKSVSPMKSTHSQRSKKQLWAQSEVSFEGEVGIPIAFSYESLKRGLTDGSLDGESGNILKMVTKQPGGADQYENMTEVAIVCFSKLILIQFYNEHFKFYQVMLLRNPSLSTTVEIPNEALLRKSEVLFGPQKDMYKNADVVLQERDARSLNKNTARHIIAMARIEQNVGRIGTMLHFVKPHNHDEILLPKQNSGNASREEYAELSRSEEQRMHLRLVHSALLAAETAVPPRPLDRDMIERAVDKVEGALEVGPEWEARMRSVKDAKKRKKARSMISQVVKSSLEMKLRTCIKDVHRPLTKADIVDKKKFNLTTRMLLPYYKVDNVKFFMDVFSSVDSDFSGDLDVNEWVKLFTTMDATQSAHNARMIFLQIDKSGDGFLSMKELIPIVFNQATKNQQKLILKYSQSEIIKKRNDDFALTPAEIFQLFECYDIDSIGFVTVSLIRDRIRAMALPESAHFGIMDTFSNLEEDEMLNEAEFTRIFRRYVLR